MLLEILLAISLILFLTALNLLRCKSSVVYNSNMKLVLCSEGFHTQNTVEACELLVGKPRSSISVGVINEAFAVEDGDKRWVIDTLNAVAHNFRGDIDIINLLALSIDEVASRLASKDVLFVMGGDADYLMHVFEKTRFDKLLPTLLKTKVYVGSSAGSMVVGERVSTAVYTLLYEVDNRWNVRHYLGFVNLAILPHYGSPYFLSQEENLQKATGTFQGKMWGLRDDSAVIVDGSDIRVIGSRPMVIEKGA